MSPLSASPCSLLLFRFYWILLPAEVVQRYSTEDLQLIYSFDIPNSNPVVVPLNVNMAHTSRVRTTAWSKGVLIPFWIIQQAFMLLVIAFMLYILSTGGVLESYALPRISRLKNCANKEWF